MPHVKIRDLDLYYEEEGDGEPLFLMHGAASCIDHPKGSWAGLRGLFSAHFRTFSIEHRGHGRTNNPEKRFDYRTLADDTIAFADAMDVERFHLAGISDGAIVGLELGMRQSDRLRNLVLLGSNYRNDDQTRRANAAWAHLPDEPDDSAAAIAQSCRHDRAGKQPGYWRSLCRGLVENVATGPAYTEDDLGGIRRPVLLLAGDADDYANSEQLAVMHRSIPASELCVINNAGHTAHYSHPHLIGPIVLEFLLRSR